MRRFRKFFACCVVIFLSLQSLWAFPVDLDLVLDLMDVVATVAELTDTKALPPTDSRRISGLKKSTLKINSNVPNAEVYLNGLYQGRTPLTIEDVYPGQYRLELKKSFYKSDVYTVTARSGYEISYTGFMEEELGEIRFHKIPSDASVYVDNALIKTDKIKIIAGQHEIRITKFGYEAYHETVFLKPDSVLHIKPELIETGFVLSGFSVSRDVINPDLRNYMGKTEVSFNVTRHGSARLQIFAPDGTLTNSCDYSDFETWKQTYVWNGRADDGSKLADGLYWFELDCDGKTFETCVRIDRNLRFPLMNNSVSGFAYGDVPAIEPFSIRYGSVAAGGAPLIKEDGFSSTGIETSVSGCFNKYFSGGACFQTFINNPYSFPFCVSGNFRYSDSFDINVGNLCWGAFVRYGYGINYSGKEDGIGTGLLLGFANKSFSATTNVQYVIDSAFDKNLLSAGEVIAYKRFPSVTLYESAMFNFLSEETVSCSIGLNWMPMGSGFLLYLNGTGIFNYMETGDSDSLKLELGFTLLF
ncbi:MAG: PEGA domain-containing protein [Treponema sp.]|nr:PEGA domain-containing protein [Treponema sp.]